MSDRPTRFTNPVHIEGAGNELTVSRDDTGETLVLNAPHIFFKRPQFNAAFFLRGGEGGDLYFQDQDTGTNIRITDRANGTLAGGAAAAPPTTALEERLAELEAKVAALTPTHPPSKK